MSRISKRTRHLKQSSIRAASQRCQEVGGINLGQGICDIAIHPDIKQAAQQAIFSDKNTYAPCEGILPLRQALSEKLNTFNHIEADPDREIIITHGATGAYVCAAQVLFNPGDEVILFEPFYGYHKHILELQGLSVNTLTLDQNTQLQRAKLEAIITTKTRGIVVCTPCNPSGKVFTLDELTVIGELAKQYDLHVITDEIYEYITYPGFDHISLASLADYYKRTVTISGFSKTYNMTGWRLGYACGPADILEKMALVHDLIYVCPPTPLQYAVLDALQLDQHYYQDLRESFLQKRDLIVDTLEELGLKVAKPHGAYYLMADISGTEFKDDIDAAHQLLEKAKIATVPGRAFFNNPEDGKHLIRICYALNQDILQQALSQLRTLLCKQSVYT